MARGKTRRVRVLEEAVYRLLTDVKCATTSDVMRIFSLSHTQAFWVLKDLWRDGRVQKHIIGRVGVWCAGEVDVLEVYAVAFHNFGYNIGAVVRRLAEIFESAKSRRLCVDSNDVGITHPVVVINLFYRFMESVFGCELYKTGSLTRKGIKKFKRVYACIDAEEARAKIRSLMDRLSQIKRIVAPPNPTDLIPPIPPSDSESVDITFHVPRSWLEAINELVAKGVYKNRSEVVREAIRQMLDALKKSTS
jgi:hypothetical protein